MTKQSCAAEKRTVTYEELPLYCPMGDETMWNAHPRVFLAIEETGYSKCPYCGTEYILKNWKPASQGN